MNQSPRSGDKRFIGQVESLSHDGDGVVKVDQKVYFVAGALPGESITFSSGKKKKGRYIGHLEQLTTRCIDRVEPECPYFGICGGCVLQHLNPLAQLRAKQTILIENLWKIGRVETDDILPAISESPWNYRRKARLGLRFVPKKGGILIGYRERRSNYITALKDCLTLDRRIARLLPSLHTLIDSLSCKQSIPQIECAAADNTVALVFRHLQAFTMRELDMITDYSVRNNIQVFTQDAGPQSITPLSPSHPEPLYYQLPDFNLKYEFGPVDFIQVNAAINLAMVKMAIDLLDVRENERLLDLFCGLGNFTLPLARQGGNITGLEGDERLVELAGLNAKNNGVDKATFIKADLHRPFEVNSLLNDSVDKVLMDPPRLGAWEVIKQWMPVIRPRRIVYISCNPATLARDSAELVHQQGYRLSKAGVLDMFPHTAHIESIAVFDR